MKYSLTLDIQKPLDEVVAKFDDPDSLFKWQEGLQSIDHISGEFGQVGSKYKLVYQMGKRTVEMVETIVEHNLPESFVGTYEAKNVWNQVGNRFESLSSDETRWYFDSEFRCDGFLKIMAFLMPWMFKKESFKYMQQFKAFVEAES